MPYQPFSHQVLWKKILFDIVRISAKKKKDLPCLLLFLFYVTFLFVCVPFVFFSFLYIEEWLLFCLRLAKIFLVERFNEKQRGRWSERSPFSLSTVDCGFLCWTFISICVESTTPVADLKEIIRLLDVSTAKETYKKPSFFKKEKPLELILLWGAQSLHFFSPQFFASSITSSFLYQKILSLSLFIEKADGKL